MGAISSLASVLGISDVGAAVTAAISPLDPTDGFEQLFASAFLNSGKSEALNSPISSFQAFQYFPATIQDTKSPEWSRKNVPGGSHPIVSFINGGERLISFAAIFTQDDNPEEQGLLSDLLTGNFDVGLGDLFGGSQRKDTADIAGALGMLRKYTYPKYNESTAVASAPPFAIVYLPNSGIIGQGDYLDSIVGAMIQCDVTYEKFHRNGAPRIVVVQLSFLEVVQIGDNWKFVGSDDVDRMLLNRKKASGGVGPYSREVIGADQGGAGFFASFFE